MTRLRVRRCVGAEHESSGVIPAQARIHFQPDETSKWTGVRQDDAPARAAQRRRRDGFVIPAQAGIHFPSRHCVTFDPISSP
jgi:hypothetical protein